MQPSALTRHKSLHTSHKSHTQEHTQHTYLYLSPSIPPPHTQRWGLNIWRCNSRVSCSLPSRLFLLLACLGCLMAVQMSAVPNKSFFLFIWIIWTWGRCWQLLQRPLCSLVWQQSLISTSFRRLSSWIMDAPPATPGAVVIFPSPSPPPRVLISPRPLVRHPGLASIPRHVQPRVWRLHRLFPPPRHGGRCSCICPAPPSQGC